MKIIRAVFVVFVAVLAAMMLAGCPSVDISGAMKNSRAGCARTSGMGYSVVITTANSDQNAKTDDEVDINPETCAMKIRNIGTAGAKPVPGTVMTITTPATSTTTVTPAPKP